MEQPQIQIKIVYSSYTPAQKKASSKWVAKNKEHVNTLAKDTYQRIKLDPERLEKRREKARINAKKRYYEKKDEKMQLLLV